MKIQKVPIDASKTAAKPYHREHCGLNILAPRRRPGGFYREVVGFGMGLIGGSDPDEGHYLERRQISLFAELLTGVRLLDGREFTFTDSDWNPDPDIHITYSMKDCFFSRVRGMPGGCLGLVLSIIVDIPDRYDGLLVTTHRQLEWTRFGDFGRSVW